MERIKLNTGITTRFQRSGGEVKVTTDTEKNFLPYLPTFMEIKYWRLNRKLNRIKNN